MTSSLLPQIGKDIEGEATNDNSGWSVSLSADGSIVAIGATYNDGNGTDSGHVRIYKNVDNQWTQLGNDINGEAANDEFGYSVSLSDEGNVVAVGAHQNLTGSGYVSIYKNVNGTWTKVGSNIEGENNGDNAGRSVSLSSDGSIVAIGAILHEASGSATGNVRVYKNINDTWIQIGRDIDGEDANSFSGRSVSLSSDGSIVAIGADRHDGNGTDSGHVRIYKNVDNNWIQVGHDIDGENALDRSGWSVSLSADGSIVAIGASHNDGNGTDSGHVRIYKNIDNNWIQVGHDINGEASDNYSGVSVSLSSDGSLVAIGAFKNDGNGTDSGHVRIYKNVDNNWIQVGHDIDGEATQDTFGISVSLSSDGSFVAVGGPRNDGNGIDSGHTRVYRIDLDTTAPSAPISLTTTEAITRDTTPTITGIAESGSIVTLYKGSISDNKTITYKVSVEQKTSKHNSYGSGSGLGYKINNNFAPYLSLTPGNTYIFDQSDSSNLNHPLFFYLDSNKTNSYTDNVLSIGTPGTSGAYTQIKITSTTPETLHYQCSNHGLMGDSLRTNLGTATADSNGAFSITSTTLSEGNYSLNATATDNAGNTSSASSALSITIDTTAPSAPTSLTNTSQGNDPTPTINGTAEAGSTVNLYNGSILLGSTNADTNGVFSITSSSLSNGNYSLTATATDSAGNISQLSSVLSIEVNQNLIAGDFEWAKLYGSVPDDYAHSLTIANDGSIFVTGSTESNLNGENSGLKDIFLMKLDSNGNELWTKLFGTDKEDKGYSVNISEDGSIFLIGETEGNLNGQINNGVDDAFVMKLDSNGNELWTKLFGTELSDIAWSGTSDKNIYLWGETHGNLNGQINNSYGAEDSFLIKLDSNGNEIWTTLIGTESHEEAWDIAFGLDDSVYIAGETQSFSDEGNSYDDVLVSKIDKDGKILWSKSYGELPANDVGYSIEISSEGYLYVSGSTKSDLNGEINNGGVDSFIIKLDSEGNELWTKLYGTAIDELSFRMRITSEGYIYLGGRNEMNNNDQNGFVKKLDLEGNELWTKIFGIEYLNDLYVEKVSSSIFITGHTKGDLLDQSSNGGWDAIVLKFDDPIIFSEKIALNYISSNPDLIYAFGIDTTSAISHYDNHGKSEGRSLNAFSASDYLAKYSDLSEAFGSDEILALKHYIQYGFIEGRTDSDFGSDSVSDSGESSDSSPGSDSGSVSGSGESSDSSAASSSGTGSLSDLSDFQALNYIASNNDLISSIGLDVEAAKSHYTNYGKSQERSLDSFSAQDYLAKYADLLAAFGDDQTSALKHYIEYGYSEGRTDSSTGSNADSDSGSVSGSGESSDSSAASSFGTGSLSDLSDFQALNYIASYGDLINAFGTDLTSAKSHYTNYGKSEGRTLDNFDEWGYLASNNDLMTTFGSDTTEAVKHYISFGYSQGKLINSFNAQSYLNNYADLRNAFGDNQELATRHYVEFGFNEGRVF